MDENLIPSDFCRNCGSKVIHWKGWELCDVCKHRHCFKSGWHDPLPENKEKYLQSVP